MVRTCRICREREIESRMAKPHVLVIPYPVQGHVIPLMELSLCLVKHGIKVSFVNTKHNHERIMSSSFHERNDLESQLCLVWIPDGDGSEFTEKRKRKTVSCGEVLKDMPRKVEELIDCMNASESEKISCVVADQSIGWALEIAEKKGIQRAAFCPASAAQLVMGMSITKLIDSGIIDKSGIPLEKQVIQLSPTMASISTENLAWVCVGNQTTQKHIFELMMRNIKTMNLTQWLLCNSTYDLEPSAFTLSPNIIPIGPLLASNHSGSFWPQDHTCMKWLDQNPPRSVIYVAFGSFTSLSPTQFQELALGLELCNRPFLWVVQPDSPEGKDNTVASYPEGFEEERAGGRGRMVGWAPQREILSHPSVACFISHCGWNSTMESVCSGVPILCWPHCADQFLNQSYVCDVWRVGIGLERDGSGIIIRDEIRDKIEKLLNDENLKERAKYVKENVLSGIGQGGGSNSNLDSFIKWINKV